MIPAPGLLCALRRRTTGKTITVRGIGIHTGASVTATLVPVAHEAAAGSGGVVFRLAGNGGGGTKEIAAHVSNVVDTARCTVLGSGGVSVATVEHLMSALSGAGISDVIVEVDGPELPIGDGSAQVWTEALAAVGSAAAVEDSRGGAIQPLTPKEPIVVYGDRGAFVAAYPSDALRLTVATQFDHALAGTQVARWEPARDESYAVEVAPARTFGFDFEVEALRAAGLARGGSLENALVIYDDRYSSALRFPNELARHKLLDLIGDLALVGLPVVADIVAVRPSHRLNVALADQLFALYRQGRF